MLLDRIGMRVPIVQAPMAGVTTPRLAAAVANAGGLGSLGVAAMDAARAAEEVRQTRALTPARFNVNVFCHRPPRRDAAQEAAWLGMLAPDFARFGAVPPAALEDGYRPFALDPDMLAMLLAERPGVVSFHFGLPPADQIAALRDSGAVLLGSATNRADADRIVAAGLDGIVAQGWLAGGATRMTRAISGRPARGVDNLISRRDDSAAPDYPLPYSALKALHAVASMAGETGYGPFWAGTGCAAARPGTAAEILGRLAP